MNSTVVLKRAIEVLAVLFAAFGGFLLDIAPPDDPVPGYAAGVTSIAALVVVLLLSASAKDQPPRRYKAMWLSGAAICLVLALWASDRYRRDLGSMTFPCITENYSGRLVHGGTAFKDTPIGKRAKRLCDEGLTPEKIARKWAWDVQLIWKDEALEKARRTLRWGYFAFVITAVGAVFSLTEGILVTGKAPQ